MANSLASLKSLPCPAGDKCTAFQCLFKHGNDIDLPVTLSKHSEESLTQEITTPSDQVLPRKRIKLNSTTPAPPHPQVAKQDVMSPPDHLSSKKASSPLTMDRKRPVSEPAEAEDSRAENHYRSRGHLGAIRLDATQSEGSLSLARSSSTSSVTSQIRKSPSLAPHTMKASSVPTSKVPSHAGSTASTTSTASTVSISRASNTQASKHTQSSTQSSAKKPETLNPRLLKKSPAQHGTRLKLVGALHEQYARLNSELKKGAKDKTSRQLLLSDQELIIKTLDDEEEVAIKRFQIYANAIRNKIMAYKRMTVAEWKEERTSATKTSDEQTAPDLPKPIDTGLTRAQEVDFVPRLVWPFDGLQKHGYVSKIPLAEDIEKARASVTASGNVEVCDRCTRRFQVFPGRRDDGALASNGTCTYHPGKVYFTERGPGKLSQAQKKYRCCHQNVDDDSGGCATASTHVFKTTDINRLASILNFCETPHNPTAPKDRAVCFDCEMGYTVYGLELIRVTALSWPNYEILADILVQPYGEVLDLNTRYSGVTPEAMASAERWVPGEDHRPTPSSEAKPKLKIASDPKAARDLLFSLISTDTPLIGHGLENDLNAIRIIHPTCIDTILLFPHKRGLPHRNSLKMLMETLLNKKIQQEADESTPEGHDSAEDAKAAGELVRLKVRDEWKNLQLKGWIIRDGEISVTPPDK
ncbi:uncharacterized protein GGS22DRAFT_187847 [Annulohypoxylon maeteangense]|uniref:uncharacterized protein n=1 Tax=Annulohypoxylon maeteangense TaxID=1927788 RepID=UPI0020071F85|nr:uncharacterized protein GGS22DRAFT_187847 [Annulohypoxylon maeteangense]KAI0885562.1 hypothetical protein GGS22DRAFT_187847 [Annulohypoxylon maeteangense]